MHLFQYNQVVVGADSARSARHLGSNRKGLHGVDIGRARAENLCCPGVTTQGGRRKKAKKGEGIQLGSRLSLLNFAFKCPRNDFQGPARYSGTPGRAGKYWSGNNQ